MKEMGFAQFCFVPDGGFCVIWIKKIWCEKVTAMYKGGLHHIHIISKHWLYFTWLSNMKCECAQIKEKSLLTGKTGVGWVGGCTAKFANFQQFFFFSFWSIIFFWRKILKWKILKREKETKQLQWRKIEREKWVARLPHCHVQVYFACFWKTHFLVQIFFFLIWLWKIFLSESFGERTLGSSKFFVLTFRKCLFFWTMIKTLKVLLWFSVEVQACHHFCLKRKTWKTFCVRCEIIFHVKKFSSSFCF